MPGLVSSTPKFYLTKDSGKLALCQGANPNHLKHADKRVLIVGGGVTGLTVRFSIAFGSSERNLTSLCTECLGFT